MQENLFHLLILLWNIVFANYWNTSYIATECKLSSLFLQNFFKNPFQIFVRALIYSFAIFIGIKTTTFFWQISWVTKCRPQDIHFEIFARNNSHLSPRRDSDIFGISSYISAQSAFFLPLIQTVRKSILAGELLES